MEKKIDEIRENIFEIKLDLKEHMRRTEQNELMINLLKESLEKELIQTAPVKKAYVGAKWSIGALLILGSLISIALKFIK